MLKFFTDGDARHLAWNAATISERFAVTARTNSNNHIQYCDVDKNNFGYADVRDTDLITDWAGAVENSTVDDIISVLSERGFSPSDIHTVNIKEKYPEPVSLPDWISEADDLLSFIHNSDPLHIHEFYKPTDETPFIHFLSSIVGYALSQLNMDSLTKIPTEAITTFQDALYKDLLKLATKALFTEFRTYIAVTNPTKLQANPEIAESILYTDFIELLHTQDGLQEFTHNYPVLIRFITTRVTQWVQIIQELDTRLQQDWAELRTTFDIPDEDSVNDIDVLPSDSHDNGRRVIRIMTTSGVSFVYKPRSVVTTRVFDRTVATLARSIGETYPEKTVIDRGTYGYVSYVKHKECESSEHISQYYRRAGCVLAAAYLTGLNDCHYENVIAAGDRPVVVDVETMFTLMTQLFERTKETAAYTETLDIGVMRTGLLPQQHKSRHFPDNAVLDGFRVPAVPVTGPYFQDEWNGVNTDAMMITEDHSGQIMKSPPKNVPHFNNTPVPITEYVPEIVQAFRDVCLAVVNDEVSLSLPDAGLNTRVLFRTTREYAKVLSQMQSLDGLQDGRYLTFSADSLLTRAMLDDPEATRLEWQVFDAERMKLTRLDIPRFEADAHTGELAVGGMLDCPSGIESARRRITSLTREKIQEQIEYIRLTCQSGAHLDPDADLDISIDSPNTSNLTKDINNASRFTRTAEQLYGELMKTEVSSEKNGFTWLVRSVDVTDPSPMKITPTENGLYEGRAGIAVFAAAIASVTDRTDATKTAKTLAEIISQDIKSSAPIASSLGLGGGLAGKLYALIVTGTLLNEPPLIDTVHDAVSKVNSETIRDATQMDVVGGVAGLTLAITALHERRPTDETKRVLTVCQNTLFDAQTIQGEYHVWETSEFKKPPTGFAHGQTGISYAISRLPNSITTSESKAAARSALQYEDTHYDDKVSNWRDIREDTPPFTDAWCYGRAGMIPARRSIANRTPSMMTGLVCPEVNNIKTRVKGEPAQLCCGVAGRVNTLLTMATIESSPVTAATADRMLSKLEETRRTPGGYRLECHTPRLHNVGLFQGTAGIGYTLLRAATRDEEQLPNILLVK